MKCRFELGPADHKFQAEQLFQYQSKGGDVGLWWESKDFWLADREAIQRHMIAMTGPDRRLA